MKKLVMVFTLAALAAGAFFGYKMWKGEGCCGWGGDNVDPWTTYTPPADDFVETPKASDV